MECEWCKAEYNLSLGKKTKLTQIIRTKTVCNKCYNIIKADNKARVAKGLDIPASFDVIIDLRKFSTRHLYN